MIRPLAATNGIVAFARKNRVVPQAAINLIIAPLGDDGVVAFAAVHIVVAVARVDNVKPVTAIKRSRPGCLNGVRAATPVKGIGSASACEPIIAKMAQSLNRNTNARCREDIVPQAALEFDPAHSAG